jgi:hypothetical protein
MSQRRLSAMSEAAFDALIEGHIERAAAGSTDMPAGVFVDILLERMAENSGTTITLAVDVAGDHVTITPDRDSGDVVVHGNEILIGGHRLILQPARSTKDEG